MRRWIGDGETGIKCFTLLRRKPRLRSEAHFSAQARVFRPWMNARGVPFEAPKERSRVCFGGFRPTKHVEEPRLRAVTHFGVQARALARGAPLDRKRDAVILNKKPFHFA